MNNFLRRLAVVRMLVLSLLMTQPFSWFAAFAPADAPEIVVVALAEEGGTGALAAAPIVRRVLESHFGIPRSEFAAGSRSD